MNIQELKENIIGRIDNSRLFGKSMIKKMVLEEFGKLDSIDVDISGWKGKDKLEVETVYNGYMINEHRKDKETFEVKTLSRFIPIKNVEDLWDIISKLNIGEEVTSKYLAQKIISEKNLLVTIDAFWGGKNRSRHYFPLLYYPLKILEWKGDIKYFGKGKVMRLI